MTFLTRKQLQERKKQQIRERKKQRRHERKERQLQERKGGDIVEKSGRSVARSRQNHAAAARGGTLADSDPFLCDLRRQRVGPHAVNADLVIVVAERQQGRRAFDEPVAASPIGKLL